MLSTVKLAYPHSEGSIGIVPWLEELPSLLQKGIYADVVLHPMKKENESTGNNINNFMSNVLILIT